MSQEVAPGQTEVSTGLDRNSLLQAGRGALLGISAPLGWLILDAIAFRSGSEGGYAGAFRAAFAGGRPLALILYMLCGTSLLLAVFGLLVARKDARIIGEQTRMAETYRLYIEKEEVFVKRLHYLQSRMGQITQVSASIQRSNSLEDVFRLCADGIHSVLDFDRVNIFLVNGQNGMLECRETRGNMGEPIDRIRVPLGEAGGILALAILRDRPYVVKDPSEMKPEYRLQPPYDGIRSIRSNSFMIVPFHDGKEPIGLFAIDNKFKRTLIHDEEVDIVKVLADQTSVAISNIRLIQGIRRMDELMERAYDDLKAKRERYAAQMRSLSGALANLRAATDATVSDADEIGSASDEEASLAQELTAAAQKLSSGMDVLLTSMSNVAAAAAGLTSSLEHIKASAEESSRADEAVEQRVRTGADAFEKTRGGIQSLSAASVEFARTMEDLVRRSSAVKDLIGVIDEVMDQTKLLALNAAIISAQAGAHGRGFSVVAGEIGKLSRDVEQSTSKIRAVMDGFEKDLAVVAEGTDRIRREVEAAAANSRSAESTLLLIEESFRSARASSLSIREKTLEQAGSVVSVAATSEKVSSLATGFKAGAESHRAQADRIARSSEAMRSISGRLRKGALVTREGTGALMDALTQTEQLFETMFVGLSEWRDLGRQLRKELDAFGG